MRRKPGLIAAAACIIVGAGIVGTARGQSYPTNLDLDEIYPGAY